MEVRVLFFLLSPKTIPKTGVKTNTIAPLSLPPWRASSKIARLCGTARQVGSKQPRHFEVIILFCYICIIKIK